MINRFQSIYNRLMDDRSKYIFKKRLIYSLTGDESCIRSLGWEYEADVLSSDEWLSLYEKLRICGNRIALYSAGYWGRELIQHTKEIPWKYVVDSNPRESLFCGIPVIGKDEFLGLEEECTVVISSRVYYEEIRDGLIKDGISEDKIIDGAILFDMSEGKQYFDLYELPHIDGEEVFLDVGCYDGLSTVLFDKWCDGKGFSFCFEPDKTNINRIHRILRNKKISSYKLINKGAWSKSGKLSFVSTGNSVSHISEDEKGTDSIDVVALDDEFYDKRVTFIKMDIEGAEYEALNGAERILKNQKPKLAICVYHKPEDIWELPELILKFNDSYKFYLRHYSYQENETVLYAF